MKLTGLRLGFVGISVLLVLCIPVWGAYIKNESTAGVIGKKMAPLREAFHSALC